MIFRSHRTALHNTPASSLSGVIVEQYAGKVVINFAPVRAHLVARERELRWEWTNEPTAATGNPELCTAFAVPRPRMDVDLG